MKRLIGTLVLMFVVTTASADYLKIAKGVLNLDKETTPINTESKYYKFHSQNGGFIRYIDYEIPGFKTSEALIESAKIRRYIDFNTNENTFFLFITVGKDKHTEIIAYDDLIKVIDATKKLAAKCKEDIENNLTIKCYYTTVDGFRIGYNAKEGTASWFFTVRGAEYKFSKDFDFEKALSEAKEKMENLQQLKQAHQDKTK